MSSAFQFAADDLQFAELLADLRRQVDTSARLPDWPFLAPSGFVTIYEYSRVLGGGFGDVVQALAGEEGDVFGIVGSSRTWAVWAQRDWEIGLLLTREPAGPWLDAPVPWFGTDVDLDSIRSRAGWGMPLTEQDVSTFWRNVRDRGSGL